MGTRTPDLRIANAMLYQLSYRPIKKEEVFYQCPTDLMDAERIDPPHQKFLLGGEGVEPSASALSEQRSTAELAALNFGEERSNH